MRYNAFMDEIKDTKKTEIAVVGGGAGGMLCALLLARAGRRVLLLERGERLGRKLSATGNGQGNVTNVALDETHYFTDDRSKVASVLGAFSGNDLLDFFRSLGGLFSADERGRVYPTGRQASAVTDLMRFALARAGAQVRCNFFVKEIKRKNGQFVLSDGKEEYTAEYAVLATGGKAGAHFGTDGNGYASAKSFGHTVTPLYPSLVQVKTETEDIRSLKGIRADALVRAYDGEKFLKEERGDVLFTDYGVSGNAVFYLSAYLSGAKDPSLSLSFLPDCPKEAIGAAIKKRGEYLPKEEWLGCIVNNALGRAIVRRAKREGDGSAEQILSLVKDFRLKVTGTPGFDGAQVTKGGIPLSEVSEKMESKKRKNLFFCGEILNVDGECGGYNLQWAFSSGAVAAREILQRSGR